VIHGGRPVESPILIAPGDILPRPVDLAREPVDERLRACEIGGADGAPTIRSTGVEVDASGVIEGFGFDVGQFFPQNVEMPIVEGAPQC
jgi:hypothetical protein